MLKQIAYIKNKVQLHKSSVVLSVWNMILSAFVFPFLICMAAWVFYKGEIPEVFRYAQYAIYFVIVGRCWYSCYLKKWSHSYMLDYTQKILDPNTLFCPRCYSPIKIVRQEYTYEKKIGEEETTIIYRGGSSVTYREPIMVKESEKLPHIACKEKSCQLASKTQKSTAQSVEVRKQLKDNYSFNEMPGTLHKTFRLIAGDRKDYWTSMSEDLSPTGFWSMFVLIGAILLIISKFKELGALRGTYYYLFASDGSRILFAITIGLLLVVFIAFQVFVCSKTKAIMQTEEFKNEVKYYEDLGYEIYLTKSLAATKRKERSKTNRQARKLGLLKDEPPQNNSYSKGEIEKRRKAYRAALVKMVSEHLKHKGYSVDVSYYSQCDILHAHSVAGDRPNCTFFITKETCYLRGATRVNFGARQDYIEEAIFDALQQDRFSNTTFFVDKDLLCAHVSCGVLAAPAYDISKLEETTVETIDIYLEAMKAIQNSTTPEILAGVQPEYGVIREANWNGFTFE